MNCKKIIIALCSITILNMSGCSDNQPEISETTDVSVETTAVSVDTTAVSVETTAVSVETTASASESVTTEETTELVNEAVAETTTETFAETSSVDTESAETEVSEESLNEMQEFINKIIENQDKELQANIEDSMDTMFCSMSYISAINKESLGIDYSPYIQAYRDYVSQNPDDLAAKNSKDYSIKNILDSINYLEAFKNTTGVEYPDESSFERMYENSAHIDMLSIIAEDYKEYYASGVVTVGDNQFLVVALKVKYGHNTEWVTEFDYYNIETGELLGKSFKTGIEPVFRYSLNGSLLMTIDDSEGFPEKYVWDTAAQFAPVNEFDEAAFTEQTVELDLVF